MEIVFQCLKVRFPGIIIRPGNFSLILLLGKNEPERNMQLHLLNNKYTLQILFSYSQPTLIIYGLFLLQAFDLLTPDTE